MSSILSSSILRTPGRLVYSISSAGNLCGSNGPCLLMYSATSDARFLDLSNAGSSNMSSGPTSSELLIWNPRAITLGGPSNLTGTAFLWATGIKGPLCEPLIHPLTRCGNANGSTTSPAAGNPDCDSYNRHRVIFTNVLSGH